MPKAKVTAPKKAAAVKPDAKPKKVKRKGALPEFVSTIDLAELLGYTTARIRDLSREGAIPKVDRGKFNLAETVQAFVKWKMGESSRVAAPTSSTSADNLRDQRAHEISIKIAQRERELIPLADAVESVDEITGEFLASLSSLPARITGVVRERQRLETIFDQERLRLSDRFGKSRKALVSGQPAAEAGDEDDA